MNQLIINTRIALFIEDLTGTDELVAPGGYYPQPDYLFVGILSLGQEDIPGWFHLHETFAV